MPTSDSNAKVQDFTNFEKFHDFWGSADKSGLFKIQDINEKTGEFTVKYRPNLICDEEIRRYIDGVRSNPVTVTLKKTPSAVKTVLNDWSTNDFRPSQMRDNLNAAISEADTDKKTFQDAVLSSNYNNLASSYIMEMRIKETVAVDEEAQTQLGGGTVSMTGAALNTSEANSEMTLSVTPDSADALTQEYENKLAFDITLEGADSDELTFPVRLEMPVPAGYDAASMKLYHIHDGEETEVSFTTKDNTISFTTDSFSTFVFAQDAALDDDDNDDNGGNDDPAINPGTGSGSSGGSGGGSSQSTGTTTVDSRKGHVNSLTGIITGEGDGYSSWQQNTAADGTTTWKLLYADGTYAAGTMAAADYGTPYEQIAWELVNGAWYAFGTNGIADSGLVYDVRLGGYFCIDINTGMKTGWVLLDGKWYYFNPSPNGILGIMLTDTRINGWYVDKNGVWDGLDTIV